MARLKSKASPPKGKAKRKDKKEQAEEASQQSKLITVKCPICKEIGLQRHLLRHITRFHIVDQVDDDDSPSVQSSTIRNSAQSKSVTFRDNPDNEESKQSRSSDLGKRQAPILTSNLQRQILEDEDIDDDLDDRQDDTYALTLNTTSKRPATHASMIQPMPMIQSRANPLPNSNNPGQPRKTPENPGQPRLTPDNPGYNIESYMSQDNAPEGLLSLFTNVLESSNTDLRDIVKELLLESRTELLSQKSLSLGLQKVVENAILKQMEQDCELMQANKQLIQAIGLQSQTLVAAIDNERAAMSASYQQVQQSQEAILNQVLKILERKHQSEIEQIHTITQTIDVTMKSFTEELRTHTKMIAQAIQEQINYEQPELQDPIQVVELQANPDQDHSPHSSSLSSISGQGAVNDQHQQQDPSVQQQTNQLAFNAPNPQPISSLPRRLQFNPIEINEELQNNQVVVQQPATKIEPAKELNSLIGAQSVASNANRVVTFAQNEEAKCPNPQQREFIDTSTSRSDPDGTQTKKPMTTKVFTSEHKDPNSQQRQAFVQHSEAKMQANKIFTDGFNINDFKQCQQFGQFRNGDFASKDQCLPISRLISFVRFAREQYSANKIPYSTLSQFINKEASFEYGLKVYHIYSSNDSLTLFMCRDLIYDREVMIQVSLANYNDIVKEQFLSMKQLIDNGYKHLFQPYTLLLSKEGSFLIYEKFLISPQDDYGYYNVKQMSFNEKDRLFIYKASKEICLNYMIAVKDLHDLGYYHNYLSFANILVNRHTKDVRLNDFRFITLSDSTQVKYSPSLATRLNACIYQQIYGQQGQAILPTQLFDVLSVLTFMYNSLCQSKASKKLYDLIAFTKKPIPDIRALIKDELDTKQIPFAQQTFKLALDFLETKFNGQDEEQGVIEKMMKQFKIDIEESKQDKKDQQD